MKPSLILCWLLSMLSASVWGQQRYAFAHRQMGTAFTVQVYAQDSLTAQAAVAAAFDTLDQLNARLSDYLPESELNRLSATAGSGDTVQVSEALAYVLRKSLEISCLSEGAFDVTIGPLSRLWRRAFRRQAFPDSAAIAEALGAVGYEYLKPISPDRFVLTRPGMRLDLGGIAKGYAVDVMGQTLRAHGLEAFLIDGGGDLLAGEAPPGKAAWEAATPQGEIISLHRAALATSGDTYRFLEWEGKRYSHLIDPRTGLGITHGQAVTVKAPSCLAADAFASALSIMAPEVGKKWLQQSHVQHFFAPEAWFYPGEAR